MFIKRIGLTVWPNRAGWLNSLIAALGGFALIGVIAGLTGLVHWQPAAPNGALLLLALGLFVVPSLIEELLFRGILQSLPTIGPILSVALFVLWHPLQHWTSIGPAWTQLFTTWPFLLCVLVSGLVFAWQRALTGSIWPSVLSHWLMVVAWKTLFGGPF